MSEEICQRCKEVDEDRRTLWMSCFYEMMEMLMPFVQVESQLEKDKKYYPHLYTLRVCKSCRDDWMNAIQSWFNNKPEVKESCNSGIFVRDKGAISEITLDEWNKRNENV